MYAHLQQKRSSQCSHSTSHIGIALPLPLCRSSEVYVLLRVHAMAMTDSTPKVFSWADLQGKQGGSMQRDEVWSCAYQHHTPGARRSQSQLLRRGTALKKKTRCVLQLQCWVLGAAKGFLGIAKKSDVPIYLLFLRFLGISGSGFRTHFVVFLSSSCRETAKNAI
jgi:hypothetical protein